MLRLAVLVALAGTMFELREATQNRPDPIVAGSRTTLDLTVSTNGYRRGEAAAATTLWAVCSSTVDGTVSPVPVPLGGGRWRVEIEPAIGHHGESRLVGCIEDVTIDRVLGHVASLRTTP